MGESLEELRPWMPWAKNEPSVEAQEAYARQGFAAWAARTDLPLLLFLKGMQTLVGGSGLHRFTWDLRSFEIGYWVRTKLVGHSYITEAVNGIAAFAFQHLQANRVELRIDADNHRSIAVAKRCGFLLEGTLRRRALNVDGQPCDIMVFSKISPAEFHAYDA